MADTHTNVCSQRFLQRWQGFLDGHAWINVNISLFEYLQRKRHQTQGKSQVEI